MKVRDELQALANLAYERELSRKMLPYHATLRFLADRGQMKGKVSVAKELLSDFYTWCELNDLSVDAKPKIGENSPLTVFDVYVSWNK